MKTIDVWGTVAMVAMYAARDDAPRRVGAYAVADTLILMNRDALILRRVAEAYANGFHTEPARVSAEKKEKATTARLMARAKTLGITAEVQDMGYVELSAGAFRLGILPMKG